MANSRVLLKRRKAVRNIRKITRTMELIATTRFKKALDRATEAEAYTRKIAELAVDLSCSAGEVSHPLLEKRPTIRKNLLLVLTANRGLCGGYNSNVLREAARRIAELRTANTEFDLEMSGKRGATWCRFQGLALSAFYDKFEDKPQFAQVAELATKYITLYVGGQIDRLDVAYMKFHNPARQEAVVETLLPLSTLVTSTRHGCDPVAADGTTAVDYEYAPSAADILSELVPMAFQVRLFKCFLDAAVSEQIARRIAMKAATENAAELIKSITREYNRARQAHITKELAEIIAGAEALK